MKKNAAWILLAATLFGALLYFHRATSSSPPPRAETTRRAKESGTPARRDLAPGTVRTTPKPVVRLPLIAAPSFIAAPDATLLTQISRHNNRWLVTPHQDQPVPGKPFQEPGTTRELALFLAPGADATAVARDHGLEVRQQLASDLNGWVFRATTPEAAVKARSLAATDPRVTGAFLNRRKDLRRLYNPGDPLIPANGGTAGQWHLAAANVPAAWALEVTGEGIVIGIVDDGCEHAHPDLSPHFDLSNSLNTGTVPYIADPNPDFTKDNPADHSNEDRHGTCVSGVAAATGGNGIGGTGVAPKGILSVQRIDFGILDDVMLSDAVGYHSTGGTTTIKVKNHSYGIGETFIESQMEATTIAASAANGTVHSYAAGNGFGTHLEDSNKFQPQNNPEVITVAAIGSDNFVSDYSSFGANVIICAPSSSNNTLPSILTTDRLGVPGYNPDPALTPPDIFADTNYTSLFGGTSSATPVITGLMALGKQANPALNVRLAQHALVRSADIVDVGDGSVAGGGDGTTVGSAWITNNAGFKFNQNYGFGRVNAGNFINELIKYSGVSTLLTETKAGSPAAAIPNNTGVALTQTFTITGTTPFTPLESIQIGLNITHPRRGELEAYLLSPKGTRCRLFIREVNDIRALPDPEWLGTGVTEWSLNSNAFWGENPNGTWTIQLSDVANNGGNHSGTLNSFSATARMGTPTLDTTPPTVTFINRVGTTPTNAASLSFTVKFSEFVKGVDASDFSLFTNGSISGASITGVTGGIDTYTVTVNPGSGAGVVRLDLVDNDSIVDGNGNKLHGTGTTGANDGSFTGQPYDVDRVAPTISVTSVTADGLYTTNNAIGITLNFSEPVTLASGNLQINLDSGGVITIAPFVSQTSVSATYTVGTGDTSSDLTVQSLVLLGGATLRDAVGNNATLTIAAASNLAFSRAIAVDAAGPTGGLVLDGYSGADINTQTSTTTISAHWSGFTDAGSGIAGYRMAVGTGPGSGNVMPFTDVGLATHGSTSMLNINLSLSVGTTYFVTVEARDGVGVTTLAPSDGVTVIAGGGGVIPAPPGRIDALAQPTAIQLVWTPSPTIGVSAYRLWWKPAASPWSAGTLVDNLVGTTTTVSGLTLGVTYDFQLRALMPDGNESLGVFTTGTTANPITVNGTSYASIPLAIAAASTGDTVVIQAGNYSVNLNLTAGVSLAGASPHFTTLTGASGAADVINVTGALGPSTISQLTVTGGAIGIDANNTTLTIRNVVVHHTGGDGVHSIAGGALNVINCTIAHNGAMGINAGGTTTIRNVISTGNTGVGITAPVAASVTYTDSYTNGLAGNFSAGLNLATDSSTTVLFTNEGSNDYTEQLGAVSVDGGDPGDAFANEPDFNGGRINLGAYGNTSFAATSPAPSAPQGGGGGGGGGCGLTGLEGLLLLALLRRRR